MVHPLTKIPSERRRATFIVLLLFTVLVMVVLNITGRPLISGPALNGIRSYELAGNEETAQKILDSWDDVAIVGKIHVTEKEFHKGRLSDYMNREDITFIPIHDAHIFSLETKSPLEKKLFILLNKNSIEWVIPIKEPKSSEKMGMTELDITYGTE